MDAVGLDSPTAGPGAPIAAPDGELEIALAPLAPDNPLRPSCDYLLSNPGKRFRPAVLEAAACYGDRGDDPIVRRAAVAVELIHVATLAHDDVVDDDELRRGRPTIGAHAGNLAAGLAGGWLFARAGELIAEIDAELEAGVIPRFAEATAIVCEGEMLEIRELYDADRRRASYLASIEAKTARLVAFSAWFGATVGGAATEVADRLERYGEAVGMAFQICDDILDLTADPSLTGKTQGSDLRGGVYTLPTITALTLDADLRGRFRRGVEAEELPEVIDRIRASGAVRGALAESQAWIDCALEALPCADPPGEHERRLTSLAQAVAARVEGLA